MKTIDLTVDSYDYGYNNEVKNFEVDDIVELKSTSTFYDSVKHNREYRVIDIFTNSNGKGLIKIELVNTGNGNGNSWYYQPTTNWLKSSNFKLSKNQTNNPITKIGKKDMTGTEYIIMNMATGKIAMLSNKDEVDGHVSQLLKADLMGRYIVYRPEKIAEVKDFPIAITTL